MTLRAIAVDDFNADNAGIALKRGRHEKALACFFYAIVVCLVGALFYQNFLISSSLGLTGLRDIDDLAFQSVLRKVHLLLLNGDFAGIWQINDYAYGWIYWFPVGVVTFPFYLLSHYAQIDWPLVVFPRQMSLMFAVLSLLVMRRLLRRAGVPEVGVAAALAIFCLFPTLGYFSMRFGTVNAVMFFSLLSFYFAWDDKPSTARGRFLALLALAVAGGIKPSGLLIAPLIGGLILVRLADRSIIGIVRAIALPSIVFILALIVFINPAFISIPVDATVWPHYKGILLSILETTKTAADATPPIWRLYKGVFGSNLNACAILLLAVGIVIFGVKEKSERAATVVVVLSVLIMCSYLMLSVKSAGSIGSYATAGLFLMLLGVLGWVRVRGGLVVLGAVIALMVADAALRIDQQLHSRPSLWGHFAYFVKDGGMEGAYQDAQAVDNCAAELGNRGWSGHVFSDYRLSLQSNSLTHPNTCFSVAWDSLSPAGRYCDRPVDFLVLDKKAPGALSLSEFEKYLKDKDEKLVARLRTDRASREAIERDGAFNGQHFELACEHARVKVFKAVD